MKIHDLTAFIQRYRQKMRNYFTTIPLKDLHIPRNNKTYTINMNQFIFHIVNHATYHRGQLVLALRILGKTAPMTDYIPYLIQRDTSQ